MSKTSSENIDELHFHEREAELFKKEGILFKRATKIEGRRKGMLERSVYFLNQELTPPSMPTKPLLKPAKLILKQLSTSQDYLESSQKHQNTLQNYQITC